MVDVKLANWLSLRPIWSSRRLADGVGFSLELVEVCVVGREKAQASGGGGLLAHVSSGPSQGQRRKWGLGGGLWEEKAQIGVWFWGHDYGVGDWKG